MPRGKQTPSEFEIGTKAIPSLGGLYLAAGLLFLILGSFAAAMPGDYWPLFLISLVFSTGGLIAAGGKVRRVLALILTGVSGFLFAEDFLIWWVQ